MNFSQKNVGIYSIPFCYGPTGKAITIAELISEDCNVKMMTYGEAFDWVYQFNNYDVENCSSRNVDDWNTTLLEKLDILIVIMDFKVLKHLAKFYPNLHLIFFDSLLWWRKSLEGLDLSSCTYIAQDFPGTQEAANLLFSMHQKPHIVGPVVSCQFASIRQDKRLITINYGGMESPIVKLNSDTRFHLIITKILIGLLLPLEFKINFTGSANAMQELRSLYSDSLRNVEFISFGHKGFIRNLSLSSLLITVPGIETCYEAFSMEIPTLFLPPLNSTQNRQLDVFSESGFCDPRCTLEYGKIEYGKTDSHEVGKSSKDYSLETMELLNLFEVSIHDPLQQSKFSQEILHYIREWQDPCKRREQVDLQNRFLQLLKNPDARRLKKIILEQSIS